MENGKTVAIVSYITLIGWVVALILHQQNKTELGGFHLRQSLGLFITGFLLSILSFIMIFVPYLGPVISAVVTPLQIGLLIFLILGIVAAVNEEKRPLPLVGEFYQELLRSID